MNRSKAWITWFVSAVRGHPQPLTEYDWQTRLQLVFAAALLSAIFETVAATMTWASPELRAQYHATSQILAQRLGYTPPSEPYFSSLRVFASTLFVTSIGSALLWGLVGSVVVRYVLAEKVPFGIMMAVAVLPLPITGVLSVLTALIQLAYGSIQIVPSLALIVNPSEVDIRWYSVATKLDMYAFIHALLCIWFAIPSSAKRKIVLGGFMAFCLRTVLVVAGILIVACVSGLSPP